LQKQEESNSLIRADVTDNGSTANIDKS